MANLKKTESPLPSLTRPQSAAYLGPSNDNRNVHDQYEIDSIDDDNDDSPRNFIKVFEVECITSTSVMSSVKAPEKIKEDSGVKKVLSGRQVKYKNAVESSERNYPKKVSAATIGASRSKRILIAPKSSINSAQII